MLDRNLRNRLNEEDLDSQMAVENIAVRGVAFQSSFSIWSYSEDEASNALSGKGDRGYAFHTQHEETAWWIVDLRRPYPIGCIKVFLRKGFEPRNHTLEISTSLDLAEWYYHGRAEIRQMDELEKCCGEKLARFVKLQVRNNYLHLRKVEIFSDTDILFFRSCLVRDDNSISRTVMNCVKCGNYEGDEINLALSHLSYGDRVLELGASLGLISLMMLKEKKAQRYYAVEANPALIEIIHRNHQLNGVRCEVINAAVAREDGAADFYIHRDSWASSLTPFENPVEITRVPKRSFSALLRQTRANFLICDIEGGEFAIFSEELDTGILDKVVIEIHKAGDGQSAGDLYDFFIKRGFKCEKQRPQKDTQGVYFFERGI